MSENSQPDSRRKKYYLQLSGMGVIGLAMVIFGISGWMFWLGLQVGMENAPVRFDVERIEQELASLKESVIKEKQKLFSPSSEASAERPELKFYEILKDPKPDAVQIQAEATELKTEPPPIQAEAVELKPEPPPISKEPDPKPTTVEKPSPEPVQQVAAIQAPPAPRFSTERPYTIQVASLRTPEDSNQMVKRLQKKGYSAYQAPIDIPGKGRWYRVRVGSFKDKTDAQKTMERLKSDKYQTMLVK